MARLQILELPEGTGDDRPPFLLVIDQAPADLAGFDALRRDLGEHEALIERIGARAVLVFEETIDIPANDPATPVDEAFKGEVQEWAAGMNETLARIVDAISHPKKRLSRDQVVPEFGGHPEPHA